LCTRCREIRNRESWKDAGIKDNLLLVIRKYISSVGEEYFISVEDKFGYLIGFTRLLLPVNDYADYEGL